MGSCRKCRRCSIKAHEVGTFARKRGRCAPEGMRGLAAQVAIALALALAVAKGPDAVALAAAA